MVRSSRPLAAPCALALTLLIALGLAGCGSDDGGGGGGTTASTASSPDGGPTTGPIPTGPTTTASTAGPDGGGGETAAGLHILVTNDDGVGAEGIDLLTQALVALPDTEVTVVAPAENQSGSRDTASGGELVGTPDTTRSGLEAVAVDGTPADSVIWALDQGGLASLGYDEPPDLVISGINEGQNIGPFAPLSGTLGAARTASRAGIPSLAASQGLIQDDAGEPVLDYEAGVEAVLAWLAEHRDDLVAGTVAKIDIPTCPVGTIRGTVEAPLWTAADEALDPFAVDCGSTLEDPAHDVGAFLAGFVAVTTMPVEEWDELLAGAA